jgi:hypothetical protein
MLLWLLSPSGEARAGADNAVEAKAAAREAWERQQVEVLRAFRGNVDIYLDASEVKAGQPALTGVKVSGFTPAGGAKFIYVTNAANEHWRINLEKIVACRIQKK